MAIADFETLKSIAYTSISATYTAFGSPTLNPIRLVTLDNADTDGRMAVSTDGVNDMITAAAGASKVYDVTSNAPTQLIANDLAFPIGTQFYIRYIIAPSKGSVYLETLFGKGI